MQKIISRFEEIHGGVDDDFGHHDLEYTDTDTDTDTDIDGEICLQSSLSMTAQLLLLGKCEKLPKAFEITLQKVINLVFLFIHIAEVFIEGVPLFLYAFAVRLISLCAKDGRFDTEVEAALNFGTMNTVRAVEKTTKMLFSLKTDD